MTTTTSEREARELLAQIEGGEHGQRIRLGTYGMSYVRTDKAIRAIVAALTREQREVPPGLYDLDPYVLPQQKAPSEQREGECPVCGLAWGEHRFGYAAFSCKAKPQPEAPGAVAFSFAGPDGKNSIHDTWFPMKDLPAWQKWVALREGHHVIYAYPTPPAPVDVRVPSKPLEVFGAGEWRYSETGQTFTATDLNEAAFVAYRALLDGQPAGVDDVRFAVPPSVAQKICAALAPCDNMPLSGRKAVAWIEPGTLNSARPEDFAECIAKWPNDYKHWFPVFAAPQPADGWRPIAEAPFETDVLVMDAYGFMQVAMWVDSGKWLDRNSHNVRATYWMPLPAAPSAKGV